MTRQHVVVISACSKRKLGDRTHGIPPDSRVTARERYAGRAHLRVREAIERWRGSSSRDFVEWWIVSAGFGLISETAPLPRYEATLAGLSPGAAEKRGLELGLPGSFRRLLSEFDTALIVLPLTYLRAAGAPFQVPGTQLYFASPAFAQRPGEPDIVPCGADAARSLHTARREVAAVRFALFVDDAMAHGLRTALSRWVRKGGAA